MAVKVQSHFSTESLEYDGKQLKSLFNYMQFKVEGDSVCAWIGPCHVDLQHMVDGEDRVNQETIQADQMLHLIFELFHWPIHGMVVLQRLTSEIVKELLLEMSGADASDFKRKGDDLFYKGGKLNVSIATSSRHSSLIHYGINVSNEGTPVKTSALNDFSVDSQEFSKKLIERLVSELDSVERATRKVYGV